MILKMKAIVSNGLAGLHVLLHTQEKTFIWSTYVLSHAMTVEKVTVSVHA